MHSNGTKSFRRLETLPGHLIRRFQQIAVAVFHAEVEAIGHDLTPVQYAALATVFAHPGVDQATLAGLIAYDRTTITGVVDRLAQKGLLTRKVSAKDRRARELRLTKMGNQMLLEIDPAVDAAQQAMLDGLTPSESKELLRLLAKVTAAGNNRSRAPMRNPAAEPPPSN